MYIKAPLFTPKALSIKAQGCKALRATLGNGTHNSNPHVVGAVPINRDRTDHVRIVFFSSLPRVAQSLATLGFDKNAFSVQNQGSWRLLTLVLFALLLFFPSPALAGLYY